MLLGVKVREDDDGVFIYAGEQVIYIRNDELPALVRRLADIEKWLVKE
jgi:hypothetical protein